MKVIPEDSIKLRAGGLFFSIAALLSMALLLRSGAGYSLPGCGGDGPCIQIALSRWSHWMGLPVSMVGMGIYCCGVIACFFHLQGLGKARDWILAFISYISLGAALWFIFIELVVINTICWYCTGAHVSAVLGAVFTLWQVALGRKKRLYLFEPLFAAVSCLVLLAAGQVMTCSSPRKVSLGAGTRLVSPRVSSSLDKVSLAGGRVLLKPGFFPELGSASAPRTIAVLFDYTCESCRESHRYIEEAVRKPANLRVILVPFPLDPACNGCVDRLRPGHDNACADAKLALAVWMVAPLRFAEFDSSLLARPAAGRDEAGQAYDAAASMAGREKLAMALRDTRIVDSLHEAERIYRSLNGGILPKFLSMDTVYEGAAMSEVQIDSMASH